MMDGEYKIKDDMSEAERTSIHEQNDGKSKKRPSGGYELPLTIIIAASGAGVVIYLLGKPVGDLAGVANNLVDTAGGLLTGVGKGTKDFGRFLTRQPSHWRRAGKNTAETAGRVARRTGKQAKKLGRRIGNSIKDWF